jgi:release factor glutamine methyltransferase
VKNLKRNTLTALLEWFNHEVSAVYDEHETRAMSRIIFRDLFGLTPVDFILKNRNFNESDIIQLHKAIKKLKDHMPVQYITGVTGFRNLVLEVNPDVLIPRPETEELVQWIIDDMGDKGGGLRRLWDIGTGSGAIALSLAIEVSHSQVWASDISERALAVARKNAADNALAVQFLRHDILKDPLPGAQKFDVIVSNPPYVRESEKNLMQPNVLQYEPHLALFVPDTDPLLYYRAVAKTAGEALSEGGKLYVEINEALGKDTVELFQSAGFRDVVLKKDLHGKDRFVIGCI